MWLTILFRDYDRLDLTTPKNIDLLGSGSEMRREVTSQLPLAWSSSLGVVAVLMNPGLCWTFINAIGVIYS